MRSPVSKFVSSLALVCMRFLRRFHPDCHRYVLDLFSISSPSFLLSRSFSSSSRLLAISLALLCSCFLFGQLSFALVWIMFSIVCNVFSLFHISFATRCWRGTGSFLLVRDSCVARFRSLFDPLPSSRPQKPSDTR